MPGRSIPGRARQVKAKDYTPKPKKPCVFCSDDKKEDDKNNEG